MSSYHQQFLALSDGNGNPVELFNGARLAYRLQNSFQCASYNNIAANAGCDALAWAPGQPSALYDPAFWIDAADGRAGQQVVPNRGSGSSQFNAIYGSGTAAGTDDPLWLGGSTNYLYTPAVSGNNASLAYSAAVAFATPGQDLEIIVRLAMDDWTPSSSQVIVSRYTSGVQGYEVSLTTLGYLRFDIRVSGSDVNATSSVAVPAVDGAPAWIRVTRDFLGAVSFFYTLDAAAVPTRWTQLGAAVSITAGAPVSSGSGALFVGERPAGTASAAAKVHRVIVRQTGATVPVADIDFTTNQNQSSFVATAGGTVTINRSTTGRKSVVYTGRPMWLFGTDDFLEVPAGATGLALGTEDSFTVMAMYRMWGTGVTEQTVLSIGSTAALPGGGTDLIDKRSTAQVYARHSGGDSGAYATDGGSGGLAVVVVTHDGPSHGDAFTVNGVASATTPAPGFSLVSNSAEFRLGRLAGAGAGYADMELTAALIWKRKLSTAEIAAVTTYYQTLFGAQCWIPLDLTGSGDPWYNANQPASTEALGFYIEDWTGLDGGHHTRTSTPVSFNRGGAAYGPQTHNGRVWKLNVLLHGTTERGLTYLFRWLEDRLLNCCDVQCGTRKAWIRDFCPTNLDDGFYRAENVALLEGPTWESQPTESGGCFIRRVSFTLGAGEPCLLKPNSGSVDRTSTNVGVTTLPTVLNAGCDTWAGTNRRVQMSLPTPDIGAVAPVVTFSSPAGSLGGQRDALPVLRIMGFVDPLGTGDPCRATQIGELIIEGFDSSGLEIVVDMARRKITYRDLAGGNHLTDGARFIGPAARPGLLRWWSIASCDTGFVVVEPAFRSLQTNHLVAGSYDKVTPYWNVHIESATRISCC